MEDYIQIKLAKKITWQCDILEYIHKKHSDHDHSNYLLLCVSFLYYKNQSEVQLYLRRYSNNL